MNRPFQSGLPGLRRRLCLAMILATGCADGPDSALQISQNAEKAAWPRILSDKLEAVSQRKLGFTTRNAIEVSAGAGWRQSVSIPQRAALDVSLGLPCPKAEVCTGTVKWRLEALRENTPPDVLLATSSPRPRLQTWQTERIDLGHLGGETLDLALTVEVEGSGEEQPSVWWAEPLWVRRPESPPYNVILISIDTLRQDRLGCYGYDLDTSPEIDGFAAQGVLFRQAISQAPWTIPSHASLLTSLYPSAHRMNKVIATVAEQKSLYRGIPEGAPTLAGTLRENGYRTVALTGGGTVSAHLFSRGFDIFEEGYYYLTDWQWSRLLPALDGIEDVPFFLFFHTFEVHTPYSRLGMMDDLLTEDEIEGLREHMSSDNLTFASQKQYLQEHGLFRPDVSSVLYDSGVRHADAFIGQMFDELERRGLLDRTLIVITSDHGEELGENNSLQFYGEHGHSLSEELIRVPLILRMPGRLPPGLEIDDPVELLDVAPTVLDLLRLSIPDAMQGRSLAPAIREPGSREPLWTLSESTSERLEMKALRGRQYKYVVTFDPAGEDRSGLHEIVVSEKLFDLPHDSGEDRSLHAGEVELLRSMRQRLTEAFATMTVPNGDGETTALGEETLEELRTMGYVN